MSTEIRLELLIGRLVRDTNGNRVGRLEEVIAREAENETVVTEYHVGPAALLERMSAQIAPNLFRRGYRVPWDKLDLSDPHHPMLTCPASDLKPLHRS